MPSSCGLRLWKIFWKVCFALRKDINGLPYNRFFWKQSASASLRSTQRSLVGETVWTKLTRCGQCRFACAHWGPVGRAGPQLASICSSASYIHSSPYAHSTMERESFQLLPIPGAPRFWCDWPHITHIRTAIFALKPAVNPVLCWALASVCVYLDL
jgi:hypothetical protein